MSYPPDHSQPRPPPLPRKLGPAQPNLAHLPNPNIMSTDRRKHTPHVVLRYRNIIMQIWLPASSSGTMQVALIVIMAQIGSFVPAKFASVRLVDKLFTRIGTSDSIESNSSSFMVEMQETAHIVNHATERCVNIYTTLSCILYS